MPALSGAELDQLAAGARVEPARGPVRAGLDADDVGALSEHPPDEVVRQLVETEDLVGAESEFAVDEGDGNAAVRFGGELVLEHLLDVAATGACIVR